MRIACIGPAGSGGAGRADPVRRRLSPARAVGREGSDRSVGLDGDRITAADGCLVGVLLCGDVDLLAVEPWRREAALAALEEFLRGLSAELLFTVSRRRILPTAAAGSPESELTSAVERHWRLRL